MANNWKEARAINAIKEVPDEALDSVMEAVTDRVAGTTEVVNDEILHVASLTDQIEEIRATKGQFRGLSTGYTSLDGKMGGLEGGSVILIGGETSNGKSAIALNIAVNIASKEAGVLYVTLEMTIRQMLERLDNVTQGNTAGLNLMFQKTFNLGYKDLEPIIARAVTEGNAKVIVLDYLQYLGRGMDVNEVARMSKLIKQHALNYNVAFIVIVSLRKSDAKYKRKWFETEMEDLMGTAAIGYDADVALLASRKNLDNEWTPHNMYIKILKNRNFGTDFNDNIVELSWDKTRIYEVWKSASGLGGKSQ